MLVVCGCYKLVDNVNYNLVATLSPHCDDLGIEANQTGEKLNSLYGKAEVSWVVS